MNSIGNLTNHPKKVRVKCAVTDCLKLGTRQLTAYNNKMLCEAHRNRLRRYGDPLGREHLKARRVKAGLLPMDIEEYNVTASLFPNIVG